MDSIFSRREFLKTFGACAAVLPLSGCIKESEKPNVIIVLTDDQGYGDVGVKGNDKIRTPNIDQFAGEGIDFTRFYCSPVCAPTRASLMTGRCYYRTGVIHTSRGGAKMHGDEVTLAERLQAAGYATGIFGKWHLGDNYPMRPQDQGFEQSLIHKSGGIGQTPDRPNSYFNPVLWRNGRQVNTNGYCTDVFTDAAIRFIETNKDRPFFVYLPTNAPHTPLEIDKKYSGPYKEAGLNDTTAKVYGMITNIDENFGRLLKKLEDLHLRENTIIVFLGDNGPQQKRYTGGLRGRKSSTYEGGIRVPFFTQWPARFRQMRKIDRIAAHIDIYPTILEACGLKTPDQSRIDGRSLLSLLEDSHSAWEDRTLFFQCHRGLMPKRYQNCAAVTQRYKMVGFPNTFNNENLETSENPVLELYDIVKDPGEENNIADSYPDILSSLRTQYDIWYDDMKETRQFTPGYIHIGSDVEIPVHLCRYQDSAYKDGKPTFWDVIVERSGMYEFIINRGTSLEKGNMYASVNGRQLSVPVGEGENRAVFQLPSGKVKLDIWVQEEGKPRVIHTRSSTIGDVDVRLLE
ncbi:arylsulfatase [candidate division KSB1 bacterium]